MQNIHVRKVEESLMARLKEVAMEQGISINTLILQILRAGVGLSFKTPAKIYHDLDQFAGTWNQQDLDEFNRNIADFEQIDEDLWR